MALSTLQNSNAKLNHAGADYPQSRPYQAPVPSVGRPWFVALLAAVALLMVVNVAAVVVLMQRNPAPAAVPAQPDAPVSALKPNPGSAELPALANIAVPGENRAPASPVAEVKLGAGIDLAKPAVKHPESLLEAVGGLSVAHLYQSYLNIGLLADAVESETYSDKEAMPILQKVQDLLGGVDKHLARISQGKLASDDRQAMDRLRTVSGHLRQQTTALLAYWKAGDEAQAARYHQAREHAWTQLKEMLGLPD